MQILLCGSRLSHKHFRRQEKTEKIVESLRMISLVNTTGEEYDILQERLLFFKVSDFGLVRYVDTDICAECGFGVVRRRRRKRLSGVSCSLLVDLSKKPVVSR